MSEQRRRPRFARVLYDTRFDRFLVANAVDLDELSEIIGMSRENLSRVRAGKQNPRRDTIARIVLALRHILGRSLSASELFYLGEGQDDQTPEAHEIKALLRIAPGRGGEYSARAIR